MPAAITDLVFDLRFTDLPEPVRTHAVRCVIDLIGVAAAGRSTPLSEIVIGHAVEQFGASRLSARVLFDGRKASPAGAALAGGMTIDSFDAHDGLVLTKGHAGAAILPGVMAIADALDRPTTGPEFLTAIVVAYEVAHRAGIATHRLAKDYHTSGSWNALGVTAAGARLLRLDGERLRHGLGIAEYHGPRSQMMRVIDHPTMLKDGSGWGAMTGVSAAYLARDGFTGAPALVIESADVADLWRDLGSRWTIMEMYFKPYPVCRWAQPAIRCALTLRDRHRLEPDAIDVVEVRTFHEATRISHRAPRNTEEAQYSLPFPVAAALVRGKLTPADISVASLADPTILAMAQRIVLIDDPAISRTFPAERLAQMTIRMKDGTKHETDIMPAHGDPDRALTASEFREKFMTNCLTTIDAARAQAIWHAAHELSTAPSIARLFDLLAAPPRPSAAELPKSA